MDQASVTFLHLCTGSQLKVLLALKLLGGRGQIVEIAAVAKLHTNTVSGLLRMLAVVGYVFSVDRYHWALTPLTTQLPLWTPAQLAPVAERDTQELCVPPVVVGSIKLSKDLSQDQILPTTTNGGDTQKLCVPPLPTRWEAIARHAAERLGCPLADTRTAFAAARGMGRTADEMELKLYAWLWYLEQPAAATIHSPALLVCKRLATGQKPAGKCEALAEDDSRVRVLSMRKYAGQHYADPEWGEAAAEPKE